MLEAAGDDPLRDAADGAAPVPEELQEERRLLYVAMTRAKDRLFITGAESRFFFGQRRPALPSCFAADLPPQHCSSSRHSPPKKQRRKQLKLFS